MKLSDLFLLYGAHKAHQAAKEASALKKQLRSAKSRAVPFETTVKIRIPIDDDADLDDLDTSEILSGLKIEAPPGVSIKYVDVEAQVVDDDEE